MPFSSRKTQKNGCKILTEIKRFFKRHFERESRAEKNVGAGWYEAFLLTHTDVNTQSNTEF